MSATTFERRLGLPSVIGISLGAMLGSGLFVLPGIAVLQTGPSIWLAYLVAGLGVLPAALSKAELATAMPESGGTYVYVDRTLGPLASTIGGLGLWLSLLLKSAFALVGFGAYLAVLTDAPEVRVGLALLTLIVVLNLVGVGKVAKAQVQIVLISLAGLVALALWGALRLDVEGVGETFTGGTFGFLQTVSLVYISYAGVTKVAAIAEEVHDPGRNLPRGILISLGIASLLYAGVTFVLASSVPMDRLGGDLRPIHTLAEQLGGAAVGFAAALLGILTMTSMANAGILAASRFPFAMGRDHLLPPIFGQVSERFRTPSFSILATGSLMAVAIAFLDVAAMAKLASSLMIVGFMVENLAVIILREAGTGWYRPAYRAPLYPLVQVVGLVIGAALLVLLGWTGLVALVAILVPGSAVFFFYGRKRAHRRGVVGLLGRRPEVLHTSKAEGEAMEVPEAPVVVTLRGNERSPETLVEVGCSLAERESVAVVRLNEVPEQLLLDDLEQGDIAEVESLRRRLAAMGKRRGQRIGLDVVATRDATRRTHGLSRREGTEWIVLEWRPRSTRSLLPTAPLGWLLEHLGCNLALFRNAGIRSFQEVLVLVEPGPHDALVVTTADHLAETYGANLTLLRCVGAGTGAIELQAAADYVDELAGLCHGEVTRVGLATESLVDEVTRRSASYDLLVMGAPPDPGPREYLFGSPHERLTRAAACSVLRLKAPRESSHSGLARAPRHTTDLPAPTLMDVLERRCLVPAVSARSKEELFQRFSRDFATVLPGVEAEAIEAALWERERTQNTAIGDGMALPHATVAAADRAYLGVFTTSEPVDYRAPDGAPVDVFFVTLGPPSARNTHLRILAGLAKMVLEGPVLEHLRSAGSAEEIESAMAKRAPKA